MVSSIFYFHPYLGEMLQFYYIIFFKGVGSTTNVSSINLCDCINFKDFSKKTQNGTLSCASVHVPGTRCHRRSVGVVHWPKVFKKGCRGMPWKRLCNDISCALGHVSILKFTSLEQTHSQNDAAERMTHRMCCTSLSSSL